MPGQPMWKDAENWLRSNPQANARQLRDAIGCARSTSQSFISKWRHMNRVGEERTPRNVLTLKTSRMPVEDLPALTREAVVEEMQRMYNNIELLNKRFEREGNKLIPAHLAQMTGAIQNLVKAAQLLGDSYPGLAGLVAQGGNITNADVTEEDISAVDDWLGLSVVES